jgi:hypothetical protein
MSDNNLDRLESLVARLEALGLAAPGPTVATDLYGNPGNVASGELIESAWGNAVADRSIKTYPTLNDMLTNPGSVYGEHAVVDGTIYAYVWNGTAWVMPRGTVLYTQFWKGNTVNGVMNGTIDFPHQETPATTYPFDTVATISVSALYLKTDRQTDLGALIFAPGYIGPVGSAKIFDNLPAPPAGLALYPSAGVGYTPLPSLFASELMHPNEPPPTWNVRLQGPIGGPTEFSAEYNVLLQRFSM